MADLKIIASKMNVSMDSVDLKQDFPLEKSKPLGKKRRAWLNQDSQTIATDNITNSIQEIEPNNICLWDFKDRPENELGDLESFAKELKAVGQIQPGTVRLINSSQFKYELIIGERRWRACKIAGIKFRAEIKNFSDTDAALAQAAENEERKQLSDYAKGMSYARLIEKGLLKQSDLISKLGISKQQVSRLLSFKDIPIELKQSIKDFTKVSARTAEEIRLICNQNEENLAILINFADKIASGIGARTLHKEIKRYSQKEFINTKKVYSNNNRHMFTWRQDGNGNRSISFPKNIREMINYNQLENSIMEAIEIQLSSK